jgi:hypothetical protein
VIPIRFLKESENTNKPIKDIGIFIPYLKER